MQLLITVYILCLIRLQNSVIGEENTNTIDHVIDWIEENLSHHKISIVVENMAKLSPSSSNIVKQIAHRLPTVFEDYTRWNQTEKYITTAGDSPSESDPPINENLDEFNASVIDYPVELVRLKIGVLEFQDGSDPTKNLIQMFTYFMDHKFSTRGKCFIFLFNKNSSDLGPFLRHAWTENFLDMTVVEWTLGDHNFWTYSDHFDKVRFPNPIIHTYDPFRNDYRKDYLTKSMNIMPDKLKDLNGFGLKVEVYEDEPNVMLKRNSKGMVDWKSSTGFDIFLARTLAEKMNFTLVPWLSSRRDLLHEDKSLEAIKNIDFVQYNKLETLEDVAKSTIPLSAGDGIHEYLSYYPETPFLDEIMNRTKVEYGVADCIGNIFSGEKKNPINVCVGDQFYGKFITDRFSDGKNGWVLSFVDQPVSGLLEFWHESGLRHFVSHKIPGLNTTEENPALIFQSEEEKNTPLRIRLQYFLASGYALATLVFVFEIFWKRLTAKKN
ncbi:hypothetical protein QAD02_022928 [Eretmocerus hayati]|uniref:Uncharacterized protein n=1 Tax=Eretmocerus hayati TaxID=131215 RepID=A0ACC2PV14_9HYME|nr:hypothetical protein QAD02_022928 [Eretmocerus hayati]